MRVTSMMFDPKDRNTIWAGIEIDAIHRSADGGKTWTRLANGLISDDIHDLAIFDHDGKRVLGFDLLGEFITLAAGRRYVFAQFDTRVMGGFL